METLAPSELRACAMGLRCLAAHADKDAADPVKRSSKYIFEEAARNQRALAEKCERMAKG